MIVGFGHIRMSKLKSMFSDYKSLSNVHVKKEGKNKYVVSAIVCDKELIPGPDILDSSAIMTQNMTLHDYQVPDPVANGDILHYEFLDLVYDPYKDPEEEVPVMILGDGSVVPCSPGEEDLAGKISEALVLQGFKLKKISDDNGLKIVTCHGAQEQIIDKNKISKAMKSSGLSYAGQYNQPDESGLTILFLGPDKGAIFEPKELTDSDKVMLAGKMAQLKQYVEGNIGQKLVFSKDDEQPPLNPVTFLAGQVKTIDLGGGKMMAGYSSKKCSACGKEQCCHLTPGWAPCHNCSATGTAGKGFFTHECKECGGKGGFTIEEQKTSVKKFMAAYAKELGALDVIAPGPLCNHCGSPAIEIVKGILSKTAGLEYNSYHNPEVTKDTLYVFVKAKKVFDGNGLGEKLAEHELTVSATAVDMKNTVNLLLTISNKTMVEIVSDNSVKDKSDEFYGKVCEAVANINGAGIKAYLTSVNHSIGTANIKVITAKNECCLKAAEIIEAAGLYPTHLTADAIISPGAIGAIVNKHIFSVTAVKPPGFVAEGYDISGAALDEAVVAKVAELKNKKIGMPASFPGYNAMSTTSKVMAVCESFGVTVFNVTPDSYTFQINGKQVLNTQAFEQALKAMNLKVEFIGTEEGPGDTGLFKYAIGSSYEYQKKLMAEYAAIDHSMLATKFSKDGFDEIKNEIFAKVKGKLPEINREAVKSYNDEPMLFDAFAQMTQEQYALFLSHLRTYVYEKMVIPSETIIEIDEICRMNNSKLHTIWFTFGSETTLHPVAISEELLMELVSKILGKPHSIKAPKVYGKSVIQNIGVDVGGDGGDYTVAITSSTMGEVISEGGIKKLKPNPKPKPDAKGAVASLGKEFKASGKINIGDLVYLSGPKYVTAQKAAAQTKHIGVAMNSADHGQVIHVSVSANIPDGISLPSGAMPKNLYSEIAESLAPNTKTVGDGYKMKVGPALSMQIDGAVKCHLEQRQNGDLAFVGADGKEILLLTVDGRAVLNGEMFISRQSTVDSMEYIAKQFWEAISGLNPLKAELFKAGVKNQVYEEAIRKHEEAIRNHKVEKQALHLKYNELYHETRGKYEERGEKNHRLARFENVADNTENDPQPLG